MNKTILTLVLGGLIGLSCYHALLNLNNKVIYPIATLPDGGSYDGDMVDGVIEGKGRMSWPDGSFYQGEFKNGLFPWPRPVRRALGFHLPR